MSRRLLITCLLVAGAASTAAGRTYVGGTIFADTRWTLAGEPYVVTSSVTLTAAATLTIDPGVTVLFESGTQLEVASGTLIARSGQGDPIHFCGNNGDSWRGLVFGTGAGSARFDAAGNYLDGSILEWAIVEDCGYTNAQPAVRITGSRPYVHQCTIRGNQEGGLRADTAPGIRIVDNDFQDNAADHYGGGIQLVGCAGAIVAGNELTSNRTTSDGGALWISDCPDVQILDNRLIENAAYDAAGIWLDHSDRAELAGNLCLGNVATRRTGGVYVGYCQDVSFAGNLIYGNDGGEECGGVRLKSSGAVTFDGDAILQNLALLQSGGIELNGAGNVVLSADPARPTRIQGNSSPKGADVHNANLFDGVVDLSSPANADARNVCWGTTDAAAIAARICDHDDEWLKAIVLWDPAAEPPIKGDVNGDGAVDIFDAFLFNAAWGRRIGLEGYRLEADFNIDGMINIFDAYALNANWGAGAARWESPAAYTVPEPASAWLPVLASFVPLLRGRARGRRT